MTFVFSLPALFLLQFGQFGFCFQRFALQCAEWQLFCTAGGQKRKSTGESNIDTHFPVSFRGLGTEWSHKQENGSICMHSILQERARIPTQAALRSLWVEDSWPIWNSMSDVSLLPSRAQIWISLLIFPSTLTYLISFSLHAFCWHVKCN